MSCNSRGCGVCELFSRPFICVNCLNAVHLESCNRLIQLQRRRENLRTTLYSLFASSKKSREQEHERQSRTSQLQRVSTCAESLQEQLNTRRASLQELHFQNDRRRGRLERMHTQLAANQTEMLNNHFPHLIRYQSLTHQHVSSMLLREQRQKVKQVLDILPLGADSASNAMVAVTVCGLRVPDHASDLLDGKQSEATSTALGYLLLLLDMLGSYLGGPLLHEGSFQGSTTVVWQQQTFWNRRPSSSNSVLPLYTEEAGHSSVFMPSIAAKPRSSPWSLNLGRGSRGDSEREEREGGDILSRSGSIGRPGSLTESHEAFVLVLRSIACFVRDLVPASDVPLPSGWSPVAWLLMLCELHHPGSATSVLEAAQALESRGADASSSSSFSNPQLFPWKGLGSMHDVLAVDDEDREDDDEWDVVHPPLLPPRPSEPDAEMDHWARAMRPRGSTDSTSGQNGVLLPSLGVANAVLSAFSRPSRDNPDDG